MEIEDFERHPDPSDTASDIEAKSILASIENARQVQGPAATGLCLNCDAPLVSDAVLEGIRAGKVSTEGMSRFCDKDCLTDYERQERMKKINGG